MPTKPALDYELLKREMQRTKENQKIEKLKVIVLEKIKKLERLSA